MAQMVKNLSAMWETQVQSLGWEYPLEKGMATRSSVLVLRIPWTEEPGRLQSLGPQRVRHDWVSNTHTHTHICSSSDWKNTYICSFSDYFSLCVQLLKLCPTLCDPMDYSPPLWAPLSMGFSRQEYCSGLPSPSPIFHYRLLQDIEYSSLCYTVGPCYLSILYIVLCTLSVHLNLLIYPSPPLSSLATINSLSVSESVWFCK